MPAKLGARARKSAALIVTRDAVRSEKLVYVAVANKRLPYPLTKSAIAYIGTTKRGIDRISGSAANKARKLLEDHGFKTLSFYIVTCRPNQNVETWKYLEKALIIRFREAYGDIPMANDKFRKARRGKEFDYFTTRSLDKVLSQYEAKA